MKSTLPYSTRQDLLILGQGPQKLTLDAANGLFFPLVELVNKGGFRRVQLFGGLPGKEYLCAVRALFHSRCEDFKITVIRRERDRPWEDLLHPLSKAFGKSLVAESKVRVGKASGMRFIVRRSRSRRSYRASLNIVSDGKNLDRLAETLENVFSQDLAGVVVRVVGPASLSASTLFQGLFDRCELIDDSAIYSKDLRFPISKKKNLVFDKADAEIIVILHERIRLCPGWVKRLVEEIRFFDLYAGAMNTMTGERYVDKFAMRSSGYPSLRKHHYFLSWNEDNAEQLVDGGLFVVHADALGDCRFDESLHWGEMEDVDLVLRLKLNGSLVTFDAENHAYSTTAGHFSLNSKSAISTLYKVWVRRLSIGYPLTRWAAIWRAGRR